MVTNKVRIPLLFSPNIYVTIIWPSIISQLSAEQKPADSSPQQAAWLSRQVLVKPPEFGRKIHEEIEGSTYREVEGSGHGLVVETAKPFKGPAGVGYSALNGASFDLKYRLYRGDLNDRDSGSNYPASPGNLR